MRHHFHFYADPSHGWLCVTGDDVRAAGLTVDMFSSYSFHNGPRLYLEEDCDASLFLLAYRVTTGIAPEIVKHVEAGESLIRTYSRLPASDYSFDLYCQRVKGFEAMLAA